MTDKEATEAFEDARSKAHAAARKLYGPGKTGPTSPIVDSARLHTIELLLVGLLARESNYVGTMEQKTLLELRDYWEMVTAEIES